MEIAHEKKIPVLIGATTSGIQLEWKASVDSFFVPAYKDSIESPTWVGLGYFGIAGEGFRFIVRSGEDTCSRKFSPKKLKQGEWLRVFFR